MRVRLAQTVPPKAWKESRAAYTARLKRCCADVNRRLNVEGLCRDLLSRVVECAQAKGGRMQLAMNKKRMLAAIIIFMPRWVRSSKKASERKLYKKPSVFNLSLGTIFD